MNPEGKIQVGGVVNLSVIMNKSVQQLTIDDHFRLTSATLLT